MQFKDTADEFLIKESMPVHYTEITNKAVAAGWKLWKYDNPESGKREYIRKLRVE